MLEEADRKDKEADELIKKMIKRVEADNADERRREEEKPRNYSR